MKKLFFVVAALVAMTSCDWFGHKTVEKCSNVEELQNAVAEASTDTARFDLNGDGAVDSLDIEFLNAKDSLAPESALAVPDEQVQPEADQPQSANVEGSTDVPIESPAK